MNLARFRSARRHAPLLIALALAACGGGDGGMMASVVATISGGGVAEPTATPTSTPAPTPTPTATATDVTTMGGGMPMPVPSATTVVSPALAGLPPVASGVNVSQYISSAAPLGPAPQPDPTANDGAFRFMCAPSHNAYDDPIVYPGQPGKAHLHTFFGNTLANAYSTYASLRTTGESTCNNLLNRSAYWIPAMMHPTGKVVMPDYVSIYYKRAPAGSSNCRPPVATACLALPRGLRFVFGYNMTDPANSSPGIYRWFNCDGDGAVTGHFGSIREAAAGCPTGARIGAVAVGPNCWNGKDLDSPDHRSHMAYQSYGDWGYAKCPATHPYLVPFFEVAAWYMNDGTAAQWKFSSDIAMGTEGGTTFHADWWGAWEDSVLKTWTENCIDQGMSCSAGNLGDGTMLTGIAQYPLWSQPGKPTLVSPSASGVN